MVIEESGRSHGLRRLEAVEAAVNRPKASFDGKNLYPGVFKKAASLLHSLILNHPFVDGNKRTAMLAAMMLLELNGHEFKAGQKEVENFALQAAGGKISVEEIAGWLKKHSKRMRSS